VPEYLCARILDVKYSTDVAPGFLKAIMFPLVTSFHVQKKVSRFQPLQSRKKWDLENVFGDRGQLTHWPRPDLTVAAKTEVSFG
jgi:hypothetical protein